MRNVLVPTDFSSASFDLVEKAIHTLDGQVLSITMFHAFQIPFFVSDLITNQRKPYHDLLTDGFRNCCKQIKQQYPKQVHSIVFRHLYGNTPAVFQHFVDAHDIDVIVYPESYEFKQVHKDSVNPDRMFRKSRIPLLRQFKSKSRVVSIPQIKAIEEEAVALLRLLNAQS